MAYSPFKGIPKKQKKTLKNVVIAGGIGFILYQFFGEDRAPTTQSKTHDVTNLELYYTEKGTGELVNKPVGNGETIHGRRMALQLRLSPTGAGASYIRIKYTSYKGAETLNNYTRVMQVMGGTVGKFTIEPHNYDAISLGADRVDFNIEVLPPSTGGAPKAGVSYPTYRFDYRL